MATTPNLEFFLDSTIQVNQNTNLSATCSDATNAAYDYIFDVNVRDVSGKVLNDLFNTRHYRQDPDAPNDYVSTLVANSTLLNSMFQKVAISSTKAGIVSGVGINAYGSLNPDKQTMGSRFLEILATKIFGNPHTTAAIVNDTTITSATDPTAPTQTVVTGVNTSVGLMNNSFFTQYVATDRVEQDQAELESQVDADANGNINFNMCGLIITIPMQLNGTVLNAMGNTIDSAFVNLLNGPNVGGNLMTGGLYNVPILLRLHD